MTAVVTAAVRDCVGARLRDCVPAGLRARVPHRSRSTTSTAASAHGVQDSLESQHGAACEAALARRRRWAAQRFTVWSNVSSAVLTNGSQRRA